MINKYNFYFLIFFIDKIISDKSNIFYSDEEKDKTKYYFKIFKNNDKVTEAESIIKKWLNTKDLESNIDVIQFQLKRNNQK